MSSFEAIPSSYFKREAKILGYEGVSDVKTYTIQPTNVSNIQNDVNSNVPITFNVINSRVSETTRLGLYLKLAVKRNDGSTNGANLTDDDRCALTSNFIDSVSIRDGNGSLGNKKANHASKLAYIENRIMYNKHEAEQLEGLNFMYKDSGSAGTNSRPLNVFAKTTSLVISDANTGGAGLGVPGAAGAAVAEDAGRSPAYATNAIPTHFFVPVVGYNAVADTNGIRGSTSVNNTFEPSNITTSTLPFKDGINPVFYIEENEDYNEGYVKRLKKTLATKTAGNFIEVFIPLHNLVQPLKNLKGVPLGQINFSLDVLFNTHAQMIQSCLPTTAVNLNLTPYMVVFNDLRLCITDFNLTGDYLKAYTSRISKPGGNKMEVFGKTLSIMRSTEFAAASSSPTNIIFPSGLNSNTEVLFVFIQTVFDEKRFGGNPNRYVPLKDLTKANISFGNGNEIPSNSFKSDHEAFRAFLQWCQNDDTGFYFEDADSVCNITFDEWKKNFYFITFDLRPYAEQLATEFAKNSPLTISLSHSTVFTADTSKGLDGGNIMGDFVAFAVPVSFNKVSVEENLSSTFVKEVSGVFYPN